MFLIDLSGHALYYQRHQHMAKCMFRKNDHQSYNLGLPWEVNIVPVFLTQAGITLVITTTFEFISAQSPRSMKGLLIGVFYVIEGTFSFIGTLCILPFSMTKGIWETNKNGHWSMSHWSIRSRVVLCGVQEVSLQGERRPSIQSDECRNSVGKQLVEHADYSVTCNCNIHRAKLLPVTIDSRVGIFPLYYLCCHRTACMDAQIKLVM